MHALASPVPTTHNAATAFAGGINPWSQLTMPRTAENPISRPVQSPRPSAAPKGANKPTLVSATATATKSVAGAADAPAQKKKHYHARVDISQVKVAIGLPLPKKRHASTGGMYDETFATLLSKGYLEVPCDAVAPISQALRKYLRDRGEHTDFAVVAAKTVEDKAGVGRIWKWPISELPANYANTRKSARAAKGSRAA